MKLAINIVALCVIAAWGVNVAAQDAWIGEGDIVSPEPFTFTAQDKEDLFDAIMRPPSGVDSRQVINALADMWAEQINGYMLSTEAASQAAYALKTQGIKAVMTDPLLQQLEAAQGRQEYERLKAIYER